MLKQNSFEEKLNSFFQLCDKNRNGTIDKKEFTDVIKDSLYDQKDWNDIKQLIDKIFTRLDADGSGEITKSELEKACRFDSRIKSIVCKNTSMLKEID